MQIIKLNGVKYTPDGFEPKDETELTPEYVYLVEAVNSKEGCATMFLVGIYTDIDEAKNIAAELEEKYVWETGVHEIPLNSKFNICEAGLTYTDDNGKPLYPFGIFQLYQNCIHLATIQGDDIRSTEDLLKERDKKRKLYKELKISRESSIFGLMPKE